MVDPEHCGLRIKCSPEFHECVRVKEWGSAKRSQVEALLEVCQALPVREEDRFGEASTSGRMQDPRNLATLLNGAGIRS